MYPKHAKHTLLPTAVCEKKKTSDLLLEKCDLKRLGLSSLGQQAGVAFQQAGTAFQQAGVAFQQTVVAFQQAAVAFQQAGAAFQQAGVAFQHLLSNQENLS